MSLSTLTIRLSLYGMLFVLANQALAHHSVFANFNINAVQELEGNVLAVDFRNPHSHITFAVTGDDGTAEEWLIEWSDRNSLIRRKVNTDRIKAGDRITVSVWPSYRLNRVGYFVQAILADGSTFRDCGFREFRQAVVNSTEFSCPEAGSDQ